MRVFDCFDYPVYLTSLEDGISREGRAGREEAGVRTLLCEVFGPGAQRQHDDAGRPSLFVDGLRQNVNISISHSRHFAVLTCAPADVEIGIDIEEPRDQLARVAPRVLSAEELSAYGGSADGLLRAWTLKEALYKASRHMLGREPEFASQLRLPLEGRGASVCEDGRELRFEATTLVEDGLCIAVVHGAF